LKKKPVKRRSPKFNEADFVQHSLTEATGATFEIIPPHPAFPLPVETLEWFMRCRRQNEIAGVPYLNTAWKEKRGSIWLESLAVGDTIDWIDLAYGEEQASKSIDIDYARLDDPSFRQEFSRRYPIVMDRLREFEQVVTGVAKKSGVHLHVRRAGSKGMLVFTVAAEVKPRKGAGQEALGNALRKSVAALQESYEKILNL
jgi:hypothetical protein